MRFYRLNSPNVLREYFDGELVVVNLETGTYYSIEKLGAEIWRMLEIGNSSGNVITALCQKYQRSEQECTEVVSNFLESLTSNNLLIEQDFPPTNQETDPAQENAAALALENTTFEPPAVRVCSDMQDLLLLDPIHDVDSAGWPQPNKERGRQ